MRVIRSRGNFGDRIEVAGAAPTRDTHDLARQLERPIGRGGGLRDHLPKTTVRRKNRDKYVTIALASKHRGWVETQASERGYSRAAFLGHLVEALAEKPSDFIDDLLAGTA